jgi:AI-2 transport protein TqsA
MDKKQTDYSRIIFYLLLFLSILAGAAVLKVISSVVIPVVIALLLSFVFLPVIKTLNYKLKVPWWLGIIVMFAIFFALAFAVISLLVSSAYTIYESLPKYEERFISIYAMIAQQFQLPYDKGQTLFQNLWGQLGVRSAVKNIAFDFTGNLYNFFRNLLMVILLAVFLLAEMHFTRAKIESAFHGKIRGRVNIIIQNVIKQVTRYISIKFIISLATGGFVFFGTFFAGMDFPMVWSFIAFVMNFIPTFGSIFSCVLTILFAILQFYPSPVPIIIVSLVMIGTNFILGNIVEPRIEGDNLGISPFVILVSLSLWGWMWGFIGMILAVPLMVIVKIVCENISYFHPIAILLGNRVQDTEKELSPIDEQN